MSVRFFHGFELCIVTHGFAGPDHQRIAKLDRENEVAPPQKVLPSVGKVRAYHFRPTLTCPDG